jgi:membrane protein
MTRSQLSVVGESSAAAQKPSDVAEIGPGAALRQALDEPNRLRRWWSCTRELFRRFGRDQCPVFAASLSFYVLVSLVPVLLVGIAGLGYVLHDPVQARQEILQAIGHLLPGPAARVAAKELMAQIDFDAQVQTIMEQRGAAGVVGVVTLLWAALQIFVSSVPAMNAAWEVSENRSWLRLRLIALGLLLGAGSLFLLSLLPSAGPSVVRRLHVPWLGFPAHVPWYVDLAFTLLAVAINAAMFGLIYRLLPATEVQWREAAVGGIAMGVLWELAKRGFALYIARAGRHNAMYGALGGVMILVTWIYYSSMLLLLGAEVSKLYKDVVDARHARAAIV